MRTRATKERISSSNQQANALLVVDVQHDFLPGGALAVPDGDQILAPLAQLMSSDTFPLIVATQDWHPPDHVSFASNHRDRRPMDRITLYGHEQTLWPDHCIQMTHGADLHPSLDWGKAAAIIRKATDPTTDSYSAIRNNWNPHGVRPPTGLAGYLKNRGVEHIFVCGLALDYCVKWTAEDALDEGFEVAVIWDLCRAIDSSASEYVRHDLSERGAEVITLAHIFEALKLV
jgi:nicotinamidase/pyrazinamidase